jgi:hypothetical protein
MMPAATGDAVAMIARQRHLHGGVQLVMVRAGGPRAAPGERATIR